VARVLVGDKLNVPFAA
jgi:hypothetical protein